MSTTIVTAFFDVNRQNANSFSRTNNMYINYFSFWARMKNDLVVYTDENTGVKVKKIRQQLSPNSKTTIITIADCKNIDPLLFSSIQKTMSSPEFPNFKLRLNNPEVTNPLYNYVMVIKYWCVQDAVIRGLTGERVVWLDFGFNHGGELYRCPEEFDFVFNPEQLASNKIHLFNVNPLDEIPIAEITNKLSTYIQGDIVVIPSQKAALFYQLLRDCMLCLNRCGLADDDQVLLLMAYRENPELFEVHSSAWMMPLSNFSLKNFTLTSPRPGTQNIFYRKYTSFRYHFRHAQIRIKYLFRLWKVMRYIYN